MTKPLHLFIQPPYDSWKEVYGYGIGNLHTLLRTNGPGDIFAAAAGRLSVRWPGVGGFHPSDGVAPPDPVPDYEDPLSELPSQGPEEPLPETVDLYLQPTIAEKLDPIFQKRASELNNIIGFAYLNIETASLKNHLAELLDGIILDAPAMPRTQIINLLVRSQIDVYVTAGHKIGKSGTAFSKDAPPNSREVGFTIVTDHGPIDASYAYDWMRNFIEDGQPDVDRYLALAPKRWPLINESLETDQAIALTQSSLYPYPTLVNLSFRRNLNYDQWRQVGDNQKALWRKRLLARVGHVPTGSTETPFEFNDEDWHNIFQLEAVAEFYVNFDDPWASGAVPKSPGENGYITVNFLTPFGNEAEAIGNTVRLIDTTANSLNELQPDYDPIYGHKKLYKKNYDVLYLKSDTANPGRIHLITDINMDNVPPPHIVTVESAPVFSGRSAWEIHLRPILVLIDSFGGREQLQGNDAKVVFSTPADNITRLQLDKKTPEDAFRKINPLFDTIYLPSDTVPISQYHPIARTYRIIEVDVNNRTVTVSGLPFLEGGSSAWHVPAGISGQLPPMEYNLGYGIRNGRYVGWDHYDGAMFIIFGGEVQMQYRWSSYTSRDHLNEVHNGLLHSYVSSIRGNKRYRFRSLRPLSHDYINYAFWVNNYIPPNKPEPVEGRYYFEAPVTKDEGGRYPEGDVQGKKGIMIHKGGTGNPRPDGRIAQGAGNHSAGCLVSGVFERFLYDMIDLYQEEYEGLHPSDDGIGGMDLDVARLMGLNHEESVKLFNAKGEATLPAEKWNDKIVGTLWIIRPDERPVEG